MLKKIMAYIVVLALILLFGCSKPVVEDKNITEIKQFISNSCALNSILDTQQDIILATIYYNTNNTNLTTEDKAVLNKVALLFETCNNKIMIIGNASNLEKQQNPMLSYQISQKRAKEVFEYLTTKIPQSQLYYIFCDNLRNKYLENNKQATFGNQRVEVVMLSSGFSSNYLTCLRE